jgi:5-methylthioadenosine/S-adenosylhomocysteine deaminase
VWLDPTDVELLAASGTTVAHNPTSNLRLGSGRAPLGALRAAGVPVGVGTDSVALVGRADLFAEIRLAHWLEQAPAGQFRTELLASFAAALAGGGQAARPAGAVGELGIGRPADIVVLAMSTRASASGDVPLADDARSDVELALQRASRDDVTDVVVDGREVVRDRRYLPFDLTTVEHELLQQLRGSRPHPARRELVKLLRPYVDRERQRLAALTESVEFVR